MSISASAKYALIREMTVRDNNRLNLSWLCETAGVSRSGYYSYLASEELRQRREQRDRQDFLMILEAYKFRGYAKGARGIHMRLLHLKPPVVMNLKKIRRLMKKYNLRCPIRKPNPYRQIAKDMKTGYAAPNLVNREFENYGPRKILLTDITYIINRTAPRCYMTTIIDAFTKELLAWQLSEPMEVDFVLATVKQLMAEYGDELLKADTIIHSDQGSHYTSVKFIQLLKDSELRQSLSRRANCWDNAPQESFFGHMKDEIDVSGCTNCDEILTVIRDWTDYYNNDRYQWDLAKLSPREYCKYVATGVYPLSRGVD